MRLMSKRIVDVRCVLTSLVGTPRADRDRIGDFYLLCEMILRHGVEERIRLIDLEDVKWC